VIPVRIDLMRRVGVAILLLQACKSGPNVGLDRKNQVEVVASTPTPGPPKPKLDAEGARRFLDAWLEAQNTANFDRYSALYAEGFTGTKRAADKVTHFDRTQWLADRKPMLERNPRVTVSDVQTSERDGRIELAFEQRWVTSTFADVGPKLLVLERTPEGYRIQREEMLDSKRGKESLGPCAKAYEAMEARPKSLRFFADLSSRESPGGSGRVYAEVSSQEDANRRAPDGYAWEFWVLARDDTWLAARMFASSPTGDWMQLSDMCFRADGSLAEVTDSYRRFEGEGVVDDTVTLAFSPEGKVIARTQEAILMETGSPAKPHSTLRSDPTVAMSIKQLPFKLTE